MIEVGEVRKRLMQTIEHARRAAVARRERAAQAEREYETFLQDIAVPVCRMFTSALKSEGFPFKLQTPAGSVRLVSERSEDDFLEIALDPLQDLPVVVGRMEHHVGRRLTAVERPLRAGANIPELTDEDVLGFLLTESVRFVE